MLQRADGGGAAVHIHVLLALDGDLHLHCSAGTATHHDNNEHDANNTLHCDHSKPLQRTVGVRESLSRSCGSCSRPALRGNRLKPSA